MNSCAPRVLLILVLLTAALLLAPPSCVAQTVQDSGTEEIEELESFDDFEIVDADPEPGLLDMVGRLHPALVHFPIGWITLVLLFDLLALVLGRRELDTASLWVLGLGLLAFVPAIVTGLLRADSVSVSAGIYYPVAEHRNLAFLVLLIGAAALFTRWKARHNFSGAIRWVYLAMIAAATALIGLVGHLGGKMVYGENFLPF